MTIITAIKDYLKTYTELEEDAPVWVNYLEASPVNYGIVSLPGNRIIEEYIDGSSLRSFPFAFQSMESTADELARIETSGFYEALVDWFDQQTELGNLPILAANKEAEAIEAAGWGNLFNQGSSETGIYQIQCRLIYKQNA